MNYLLYIILFFVSSSCIAQTRSTQDLNKDDYDVLNSFLNKKRSYFYLDSCIAQKEYDKRFSSSYKRNIKLLNTADSICNFDVDTLKLKFYCPIADAYKIFDGLFTKEDFAYFEKKYTKNTDPRMLIINHSNLENLMVMAHSEKYYTNKNKGLSIISEFPNMHVYGIYYTEDRKIALVAYDYAASYGTGGLAYYILRKEKKVWWKPVGDIAILFN